MNEVRCAQFLNHRTLYVHSVGNGITERMIDDADGNCEKESVITVKRGQEKNEVE